ncbi:hypothetical protein P5E99_15615 [Clostridium perfringens]|nr:hypothetical protein [Clostridium perfringens]MDK0610357.1 hypothetical protein [Clostridium perfringens]MDK0675357.1 hypothetical protein [Clostridium perfringens]MDM0609254.1 hypothetical protein [Clostridium perfringens]MDM0757998.1 hypothetical protein [Clostridium perfringens]MDM0761038.1 hypothetical protein [Clostridium perfringens]
MDMLKAYGPHKLAEITVRDIANKRRRKDQEVYAYFKNTFERKCTGV